MFERQHQGADALQHAEHALDLYQQAADRKGQAEALNDADWYAAKAGDHKQALSYCEKALLQYPGSHSGQAADADTWIIKACTCDTIGYVHHQLGNYPPAIAAFQQSLSLLRRLGDRYHEAFVLTHLGDTMLAANDLAAARDAWQLALAICDETGDPDADEVRARLRAHSD